MKRLAVWGASGHGKVVADAAELSGWDHIEFFDDAWSGEDRHGVWTVSGDASSLLDALDRFDGVVVAIGGNDVRLEKHRQLAARQAPCVSIIHPAATVSRYAALAPGSVVFAGAVINAGASLGEACIINTAATVDHDCVLEAGVHLSPGAHLAGGVRIGKGAWIGLGACIRQQIEVGREAVVGAGAVVVKPVADRATVAGVPARELGPKG